MARTIEEIYNEIIKEKEGLSSLNGLIPDPEYYTNLLGNLTSNSKVAIWRLWVYIISVAIHIHEITFDLFKSEVEMMAKNAPPGTSGWYQKMIFSFQFGDSLIYDNYQYKYPVIDESKQIIKYCAIEQRSDGVVIVKVAKDLSGEPEPLITIEKDAVNSYLSKIKFAGTIIAVSSLNADIFSPIYDIYYDPIIPIETIKQEVQNAIDEYRKTIGFNGMIRITTLTDFIQSVNGVVDPVFKSATITPDGGTSVSIDIITTPSSGYFKYNDTVDIMFNFIQEI